jgi:Bacterial membrane protein YfhO
VTTAAPVRTLAPQAPPSDPVPPSARRSNGLALAVLAGITVVVAWNRLAFDSWLTRFDLFTFFLPWYTFLGERLRDLAVPGWNPHLFSGTPFAADPESGWMYLPAMLFFSLLAPLAAFKGLVAFQLAVAAFSTYVFARVLAMGAMASLVAAVVYLTGPFLHWNTYCCLIFGQFGTWIPLALLGIELSLRGARRRDRMAAWFMGGFAVSQMLAGWIGEGWLYAMLLPAAYIGYRTLISPVTRTPPSPLRVGVTGEFQARALTAFATAVTTGIGVLGSGLALAAAGMLPRYAVNAETNLAGGNYAALGEAGVLNPPWTLDYLLAQTVGVGSGYHFRAASLGGAVVILALLALPLARQRFAVPFFVVLTLVAMILTLDTTPLHQLFYLIPRYREFHDHDAWRTMALAAIGPAMLSGAAIESLPRWRGRRDLLPVVLVPLLFMTVVAVVLWQAGRTIGWQPLVAATLTTALIAVAVATPHTCTRARRPATLTALATRATHLQASPLQSDSERNHSQGRVRRFPRSGPPPGAGAQIARLVPALILVVAFLFPTALELSGSWTGWPPHRIWERHWRADPAGEAALVADVSRADPGGASKFLQAQLESSGPFRYAGYGGYGYPGDDARRESYMERRFDPAISALLVNGRPIYLGLYDIQGYNPLHLARYDEFMAALNDASQDYHTAFLLPSGLRSPLLDLLNVRYIVQDAELRSSRDDIQTLRTEGRSVFSTPRVIVHERDSAPTHAWIVHEVRRVTRGEALPLLASGVVDPYQTALVEGTPPVTAVPDDSAAESVRVIAYEPDRLSMATQAATPGLLVSSEIYESGWRAYVDGDEVEILPTDHALRGIPIPDGEHTVEMHYDPLSLRLGLWISGVAAATMLVTFVAAGWSWLSGRNRRIRRSGVPVSQG